MKRSVKILLIVLLVLFTATATYICTYYSIMLNMDGSSVEAKVCEIGNLLDRYFIDEYDKDAVQTAAGDGAASAMIAATGDRWSYYISAADMEAHNEQLYNAYVGVGITILEAEDGYTVTTVTKGGPAEAAGVQPGDLLVEVEGQSVAGLGLDGTRDMVRGEEGTDVQMTFLRDGQRIELTLTRASITADVATCEMLDDRIGLITISNFDYHCAEQTLECIRQLTADGAEALIFDVRFNPGGLKDELVEILDVLLPEGDIFKSVDYAGREEVDRSDAACLELPMAVLINEDSYSAAEFFAAALQEYGVATVVGMQTCGKGNFQYTMNLSDGSAVALSAGKYYTPSGKSLTDVGVTPDTEVSLEEEDYYSLYVGTLDQADDAQLQAALEALRQKIS